MKQNRIDMRQGLLLVLFLVAFTAFTPDLYAQVTIGSLNSPVAGTLLDLKGYDLTDSNSVNGTTSTKGFSLPRVRLIDLDKLLPMFDSMKDASTYLKNGVDYSKTEEDKRHMGLMVYNLTEDSGKSLTGGLCFRNGVKWVMPTATDPESKFFYMPSFVMDTSAPYDTDKAINLYDAYKNQFTAIPTNRRNPSSKADIPIYDADELDYYVTGLDDTVLDIKDITDAGVLTYRAKTSATSVTYINVVFVVK